MERRWKGDRTTAQTATNFLIHRLLLMEANCVGFRLNNRLVFEFINGIVFRFKLFIYLFGSNGLDQCMFRKRIGELRTKIVKQGNLDDFLVLI